MFNVQCQQCHNEGYIKCITFTNAKSNVDNMARYHNMGEFYANVSVWYHSSLMMIVMKEWLISGVYDLRDSTMLKSQAA